MIGSGRKGCGLPPGKARPATTQALGPGCPPGFEGSCSTLQAPNQSGAIPDTARAQVGGGQPARHGAASARGHRGRRSPKEPRGRMNSPPREAADSASGGRGGGGGGQRSHALHVEDATASTVEKDRAAATTQPVRRRAEKRLQRSGRAPPGGSQKPRELRQRACATTERGGRGRKRPVPCIVTEPPRPPRRARTRARARTTLTLARPRPRPRAELAAPPLAHARGGPRWRSWRLSAESPTSF